MRPAPRFMWPTSELPICPSGKPTWRPSVWISVCGEPIYRRFQSGGGACASAWSAGSSRWPQPSRISRTTGFRRAARGASGTTEGPVTKDRCDCSEARAGWTRRASVRAKPYPRRIVPPGVHAMPVLPRLPLALALSLLLASGNVAAAPDGADIDKVNGSITAESGQVYGDLETVNGSIRLEDGAHAKDAQTVNGSVKAGDDIEAEDLGTVNGGIRVGERARISGGIETVNGGIFVARGGRIAKNIQTVNGAIGIVATELGGGIETVNGD